MYGTTGAPSIERFVRCRLLNVDCCLSTVGCIIMQYAPWVSYSRQLTTCCTSDSRHHISDTSNSDTFIHTHTHPNLLPLLPRSARPSLSDLLRRGVFHVVHVRGAHHPPSVPQGGLQPVEHGECRWTDRQIDRSSTDRQGKAAVLVTW